MPPLSPKRRRILALILSTVIDVLAIVNSGPIVAINISTASSAKTTSG